jgi:hypothetical protein
LTRTLKHAAHTYSHYFHARYLSLKFQFAVRAIDPLGERGASSEQTDELLFVTPPPVAPTITSVAITDGVATIAFESASTSIAGTGGAPVLFNMLVAHPGGFAVSGFQSPLTLPALAVGQQYSFTVQAFNSEGASPLSAPLSSLAVQRPPPPTLVR